MRLQGVERESVSSDRTWSGILFRHMGGIYFVHVGDTLAGRAILDSNAFARRRDDSNEISQAVNL